MASLAAPISSTARLALPYISLVLSSIIILTDEIFLEASSATTSSLSARFSSSAPRLSQFSDILADCTFITSKPLSKDSPALNTRSTPPVVLSSTSADLSKSLSIAISISRAADSDDNLISFVCSCKTSPNSTIFSAKLFDLSFNKLRYCA